MTTKSYRLWILGGLLILDMTLPGLVHGQANSWTNGTGGKWELGANWSLAVPPSSSHSAIFITNGVTSKFETIDAVTTNTVSTSVSNLTVSAPGIFNNFLLLRTASLAIINTFTISTGGNVSMSNSLLSFASSGRGILNDGSLTLINGTINSFAIPTNHIGNTASGQMLIQDGTWGSVWHVTVGANTGSRGTLIISGGTVSFDTANGSGTRNFTIGAAAASTGTVWLTGGNLLVQAQNLVQADLNLGLSGVGQMTVSNGTLICDQLNMAVNAGSQGTLTIAGGTNHMKGIFATSIGGAGTAAVWQTGGEFILSNGVVIASGSQMTVSNGTWRVRYAGFNNFIGGTLTMAGGTNIIDLGLGVGGKIWLKGGVFFTTNVALNSGTLNLSGEIITSNGTWFTTNVFVSSGQLTIAGASNLLGGTTLRVGVLNGATGTVAVSSGMLVVTNPSNTASLDVRTGTFTMNGGSVFTDRLVINNTNGRFTFNGGQFTTRATAITNGQVFSVGGVGNSATLNLIGGTHSFSNGMVVGSSVGSTGTVWMSATQLPLTNNVTILGDFGVAAMTVSNGTWLGQEVRVGYHGGSQGTLTLAGGTNVLGNEFNVAYIGNATGTVWKTGGLLVTTNGATRVALSGQGQMTVSNGLWLAQDVVVGNSVFGCGTLTFAGGTNRLNSLSIGASGGTTGQVWQTGGLLHVTNGSTVVGTFGNAQMTVSNGTWLADTILVASDAGSQGTLTVAGGTNSVDTSLTIGLSPCITTGIVQIAGGALLITNATGNALLQINSGTLTLSSGTLVVDQFFMTNACAHFVHTGGTLIYSNAVLDAARDDDADGISNGYEQDHGLDPLNSTDATIDFDGDGLSNLQEFLAGTGATNSLSSLRITDIAKEGIDIRVTWMTAPGKTNALDRTAGAGGSFNTNNFAAIFTVTNTVGTVTNYLDIGAATNVPAFYYRMRLVP